MTARHQMLADVDRYDSISVGDGAPAATGDDDNGGWLVQLSQSEDVLAGFRAFFSTNANQSDNAEAKSADATTLAAPSEGGALALGDDIADDISTSATLAVDGSVNSQINSGGDKDFFRITLQAGQTYVFQMVRSGGGGISDAYVELRDSAGSVIAENDDGGILNDSLLMYRPATTGAYYVAARGFGPATTGAYTLSATAIETGSSSPTFIGSEINGKPVYSWTEASYQISREGASWASAFGQSATVTYAFRSSAPAMMPSDTGGFSRFNDAQIASAEAALQAWAQVANINFVRVGTGAGDDAYSDNASILFGNYSTGAAGASAFSSLPISGNTAASSGQGDVWINSTLSYNSNPVVGDFGPHVLLHEIGHALGLSHPSDYNAAEGVTITYAADADYHGDTRLFTVMSYFPTTEVGGGWATYASTPQLHDIAAIQRLYGANTNTRPGDTVYGFNSNAGRPEFSIASASQPAGFTIWDSGGNDTIDMSGYSQNATLDLRPETFMSAGGPIFNIVIARGVVIENVIGGSGNDSIRGNNVANQLNGNGGNDLLTGGLGSDVVDGGAGTDVAAFSFARASAVIVKFGGALAVGGSLSDGLDRLFSIESLQFSDQTVSVASLPQFRALDYMAGQDDLIPLYRTDAAGAVAHYLNYGFFEGRPADNFDGLRYIAGNPDLIAAFGLNQEAAVVHFLLYGFFEGRSRDGFDSYSYLASNTDVLAAYGPGLSGAAQHYILFGRNEGRSLDTFDELRYVANYDDLIETIGLNNGAATADFVLHGYALGRSDTLFDPYQYIASNPDLILAFGANPGRGIVHFIQSGHAEGRSRDNFDAAQYLANYADVRAVYGTSESGAAQHYILYGYAEGRTDQPLPGSAPLKPDDEGALLLAKPEDGTLTTLPGMLDSQPLIETGQKTPDSFAILPDTTSAGDGLFHAAIVGTEDAAQAAPAAETPVLLAAGDHHALTGAFAPDMFGPAGHQDLIDLLRQGQPIHPDWAVLAA